MEKSTWRERGGNNQTRVSGIQSAKCERLKEEEEEEEEESRGFAQFCSTSGSGFTRMKLQSEPDASQGRDSAGVQFP